MRSRRLLLVSMLLTAAGAFGARLSARAVERRVAQAVQERGGSAGLSVRGVAFSWLGPLRLDGVTVTRPGGERLSVEEARIDWRLDGGRDVRAHVRHVSLRGLRLQRGPLVVECPASELDVLSWTGGAEERVHVRQPRGGELEAQWRTAGPDRSLALSLRGLDLSASRVSWSAVPVLALGAWTGRARLSQTADLALTEGSLSAEAVRVSLPRALALGHGEYGAPTAVALSWDAGRGATSLDLRRLSARVGGLELAGHGRLEGAGDDRVVELEVSARSELGPTLQTAALHLPPALPVGTADRLGTASFDVAVQGPLARPADLRIVPHLRYDSTPQVSEKLEFLRRPFRYRPAETDGVVLDVREGAPDFLPLSQAPPLFLRALLIAEDAGFYGHPGIDVAEIPLAWATNVERGASARGASTITQQLVKNLFLSKDKSYGRKLEEAALALLVDAALPKARILEIYLNVIEWGPGLYGLVPAARHYFGKAPSDLTTREAAFLVCLIPSPIRYHQAHVTGHVGPGMDQLIANLLAKLHSVDALSDDAYFDALTEDLRFRPEDTTLAPEGAGAD